MRVTRGSPSAFTVEFESEEELRQEYQANLVAGGLRLPTSETLRPFSPVTLTLRLAGGSETSVKAQVVAALPGALALSVEGKPAELLDALLVEPAGAEVEAAKEVAKEPEKEVRENLWDRIRSLSHVEKMLLAPKADRAERAILMQDTDPQVLCAMLKNPRLTTDEIIRIAKSTSLTFQIADLIMRTQPLIASQDVKVALIQNPKTPTPFALRLLPHMTEAELKTLARGAASQALKQAALKKLQGQG